MLKPLESVLTYSRPCVRDDVRFLLSPAEDSRVHVLLWEDFGKRWQRYVLGVRSVEEGDRQGVEVHERIGTVANVDRERQEVV